ncbi:hypothetical protein TEA_000364 [Camellia sinensis var. sinensis]|uniref:CCHC-type domain-containing protein n=1 Tax=Camellia sinensis var. sinensis TaxID=542762 RepID=A0A4S4DWC1_CAMSN|nr:hypothetical protein TEA_000364 [Camellia sinensis var. sinensis]
MASSMSTSTSTWPRRMCACGYGHCFVKISRSHKNPGRAYYVCPRPVTNKLAYKFKSKPLEHEDLMREVFTGATTTGKHHWTPGEKVVDIADGESDSVDSPGLQPFTAPYQPVVDSPPPSPIVQVDETEQGSKRKKGASSSGKSKKPSTGASVLADSFNHLSEAVRSQKNLTIRHGIGASQKYGIEACMQRIMAIPDFLSTPLFHFACIALENADYRGILMCMPDDGNVENVDVCIGFNTFDMWNDECSNLYRNNDDYIIEQAEEQEDQQNDVIVDAARHAMEYYVKSTFPVPSVGSGSGGQGDFTCYKCGQLGHKVSVWPQKGGGQKAASSSARPQSQSLGRGQLLICYQCGQPGHMKRFCPQLTLPYPDNISVAILHNIFIKGDQLSFELTEEDLEASKLYPDYKYISVDDLLDICLANPPKPKLAAFLINTALQIYIQ